MSVPERSLGRRVQCPRCEAVFRFTGQTEITLGRVPSAPSERAEMATPVVPKMLETTPVAPPRTGFFGAGSTGHVNTLLDQGETVPVINLPEMPQALRDHLKSPVHEDVELFDDPDDPVDLEIFHATPTEAVLPDVSEAEIEALFQDSAPSAESDRPPSASNSRFSDTTLPVQPPPPNFEHDPAGAAAMSGEELTEILETDVVDDELPWDFNEVALDAVIEPDDEDVLDVEAEVIEVSPEDLETDAERGFAIDTLPVQSAPLANRAPAAAPPPVFLATPVFGAVPVAGMPVAGIPRDAAPTVPAAAPIALPVAKKPIPPPTPPTKPPIDDIDLDALLQDALAEAPVNGASAAPKPANKVQDSTPGAEAGPAPADEDDLDLMSLFDDDDAPELAPIDDEEDV